MNTSPSRLCVCDAAVRASGGAGTSTGEQRGVDRSDDEGLRDDATHARTVRDAAPARLRSAEGRLYVQLHGRPAEHGHRRLSVPRQTAATQYRHQSTLQAWTGLCMYCYCCWPTVLTVVPLLQPVVCLSSICNACIAAKRHVLRGRR